mgnify:CR=1 FL=1
MALIKSDHILEQVTFRFDPNTMALSDILLTVNMMIRDEVTGADVVRHRVERSVWSNLTAAQKATAGAIASRLNSLAQTF